MKWAATNTGHTAITTPAVSSGCPAQWFITHTGTMIMTGMRAMTAGKTVAKDGIVMTTDTITHITTGIKSTSCDGFVRAPDMEGTLASATSTLSAKREYARV